MGCEVRGSEGCSPSGGYLNPTLSEGKSVIVPLSRLADVLERRRARSSAHFSSPPPPHSLSLSLSSVRPPLFRHALFVSPASLNLFLQSYPLLTPIVLSRQHYSYYPIFSLLVIHKVKKKKINSRKISRRFSSKTD